jgi:hypothetical protein
MEVTTVIVGTTFPYPTWHKRAEEIHDRLGGYRRALNRQRALQRDRTLGPGCPLGVVTAS